MKIKAIVSAAGMEFTIAAGQEIDLPEEIAKDLLKAGYAVPAGEETTTAEPKRPGRPKLTAE